MDKLAVIPLQDIIIPKNHIRVQSVDDKVIKKFSDSILSTGLLVRIILRPLDGGKYELVDGERRFRAYRMLFDREGRSWIGIPAIVEEMSAKEAVRRQVAINENRQDLTPFEKAKGYQQAWNTGYFKSYQELSLMLGKSHTVVVRAINIFKRFPKEVLDAFESGKLKSAHLQYFYRLPNQKAMIKLCRTIIWEDLKSTEARELANKMDEEWLSGDRELLHQIAEKDSKIKELLGNEIVIANLVNKSKITFNYNNLARLKELINLMNGLVESGAFRTTLTQYKKQQLVTSSPSPKSVK